MIIFTILIYHKIIDFTKKNLYGIIMLKNKILIYLRGRVQFPTGGDEKFIL